MFSHIPRLFLVSRRHTSLPLSLRGSPTKRFYSSMAQETSSSLFHDLQLPSGRRLKVPTGLFIDNTFHFSAEPGETFESV